jgi:hypothetical protein
MWLGEWFALSTYLILLRCSSPFPWQLQYHWQFGVLALKEICVVTHPQLPKGPKCGPKYAAEEGVGARSLTHNTWGVEGRVGAPGWD